MLYLIIKKEFLENIFNKRFYLLLLLNICLGWSSTFILTLEYKQHMVEYYQQINLQNDMLDNHFTLKAWDGAIVMPPMPPSKFSPFIRALKNNFTIFASIDTNPVLMLFPFLDIVFLIAILMSITALSLSYNSIAGERENGTLKLILSSGISRNKILFGKWVGGIISLITILFINLLGAIIIVLFLTELDWSLGDWLTLLFLFLLSVLYCAAFYSLGLYISCKTKSSSNSIIVALFVWLLFVVILPTTPKYLAELLHSRPSASQIQYEVFFKMKQEEQEKIKELRLKYLDRGFNLDEIENMLKPEIDNIIRAYETKSEELKQKVVQSSAIYEMVTAAIHFLSPYSCYIISSSELTASGATNQINYVENAQRYINNLSAFIEEKISKTNDGQLSKSNDQVIDIKGRPKFYYKEIGFNYRLLAASVHCLFILIFTILFFVLSWKNFLKYDVR